MVSESITERVSFEYERPETKEEEKKREKTYLEKHDERYKRIMKINDLEDKIWVYGQHAKI